MADKKPRTDAELDAEVDRILALHQPVAKVTPGVVAPPAEPISEKPGVGKAIFEGVKSGGTLGFAPAIAGVAGGLGSVVGGGKFAEGFYGARAEERAAEKAAQEAHPGAYLGGSVLGSIPTAFVPGLGIAKGATLGQVAKTGAKVGALAGAGGSEAAEQGDLLGAAKDVVLGATVGAGVPLAGKAIAAGTKQVVKAASGNIKQRILNELGEGVSNTKRQRLDAAGEAIEKEITKGPDADQVRASWIAGRAEKGRENLAKIVDKVGAKNEAAYGEIEAAGKGNINMLAYQRFLENKRVEAVNAGKSRVADGIRAFQKKVFEQGEEVGGEMPLTQLRGLTTEAQEIASSVLGSLNEHANAKAARKVSAAVTSAMDDALGASVAGDKRLTKAVETIRENNPRLHALLSIDDALKFRAFKENTGRSALVRAAESIVTPAASGAALGAFSSEDRFLGALEGAATGVAARHGIPSAARALDRAITTAALRAHREIPEVARRQIVSDIIGRIGAKEAAEKRE